MRKLNIKMVSIQSEERAREKEAPHPPSTGTGMAK
jgi:hypothetical protein